MAHIIVYSQLNFGTKTSPPINYILGYCLGISWCMYMVQGMCDSHMQVIGYTSCHLGIEHADLLVGSTWQYSQHIYLSVAPLGHPMELLSEAECIVRLVHECSPRSTQW